MEQFSSDLTYSRNKIMNCIPDGAVQHRADRKATAQTGLKPQGFFFIFHAPMWGRCYIICGFPLGYIRHHHLLCIGALSKFLNAKNPIPFKFKPRKSVFGIGEVTNYFLRNFSTFHKAFILFHKIPPSGAFKWWCFIRSEVIKART